MTDTSPEILQVMVEIYSKFSFTERLQKCTALNSSGKKLAFASVLRRNPHLKGIDLDIEVFRLRYYNELTKEQFQHIENYFREKIKNR